MHYLLFYDFSPDYLERRPQFRAEHLGLAWAAAERGELVLGGALTEPVDTGLLLFKCDSPAIPERFAAEDPCDGLWSALCSRTFDQRPHKQARHR